MMHGDRIADLKNYTREVMRRVAEDLGHSERRLRRVSPTTVKGDAREIPGHLARAETGVATAACAIFAVRRLSAATAVWEAD